MNRQRIRSSNSGQGAPPLRLGFRATLGSLVAVGLLSPLLLGSSCNPNGNGGTDTPESVTTLPGPARDESATLVRITADYTVDPNPAPAHKDSGAKLQWYNEASTAVTITFDGAVGGTVLPPGAYSHVWVPNPLYSGDWNQGYSLGVTESTAAEGPGSPVVDVGP